MTDQIFTKWHKVMDTIMRGHVCVRQGNSISQTGEVDANEVERLFLRIDEEAQHYVISPEVRELVRNKLDVSMADLLEANIIYPPFEVMTIELVPREGKIFVGVDKIPSKVTTIVVIISRSQFGTDENKAFNDLTDNAPVYALMFDLVETLDRVFVVLCPFIAGVKAVQITEDNRKDILGADKTTLKVAAKLTPIPPVWLSKKLKNTLNVMDYTDEMNDMGYCYQMAMVLMNTKGILQDKIAAPKKLNKIREIAKKPHIPDHIVIRIGHYYDREGKEHAFTGRHVMVHWRAGHTRNQPIGPRELGKHKLIYIKPCLVNYEPGSPEPEKPTRLVVT